MTSNSRPVDDRASFWNRVELVSSIILFSVSALAIAVTFLSSYRHYTQVLAFVAIAAFCVLFAAKLMCIARGGKPLLG